MWFFYFNFGLFIPEIFIHLVIPTINYSLLSLYFTWLLIINLILLLNYRYELNINKKASEVMALVQAINTLMIAHLCSPILDGSCVPGSAACLYNIQNYC
jgi:hypothetical protein